MKFKSKHIVTALDLYNKGVSLRKLQQHFEIIHGVKVSHVTILKWLWKYNKIINENVSKFNLKNVKNWVVDDMVIKGHRKYYWYFNVIDKESRFLVCSTLGMFRDGEEASKLFSKGKSKSGVPDTITSDKLSSYLQAYRENFYKMCEFHRLKSFGGNFNTQLIERYNGTVRERTKVMRSFKSYESAKNLLKGFENYYNFIREHKFLGMTPAESLGVVPKIKGNRWMNLIKA
jgi:transposase-like protein